MRSSLTPIITKLRTSHLINVDPLTQPQLIRDIGAIGVMPKEDVDLIEPELEPITPEQAEAMQILAGQRRAPSAAEKEIVRDFSTSLTALSFHFFLPLSSLHSRRS